MLEQTLTSADSLPVKRDNSVKYLPTIFLLVRPEINTGSAKLQEIATKVLLLTKSTKLLNYLQKLKIPRQQQNMCSPQSVYSNLREHESYQTISFLLVKFELVW